MINTDDVKNAYLKGYARGFQEGREDALSNARRDVALQNAARMEAEMIVQTANSRGADSEGMILIPEKSK